MAKAKGARPDWVLSALNKTTEERGKVGVGWTGANGHISIKLNIAIVLRANPDLVLTLFPADEDPDRYKHYKKPPDEQPSDDAKPSGDGIPF